MKKLILSLFIVQFVMLWSHAGEEHPDVEIHTFENGEDWTSCSFVLHSSLTQSEFNQFTREASTIIYYQPLRGASALGKNHFDFMISMGRTPIDQTSGAWNNTFAHPITDTAAGKDPHWLGDQIQIPNIRIQYGLTDKLEIGAYITRDFNANYGFWGINSKYTFSEDTVKLQYAARVSHVRLYGPDDLNLNVTAIDGIVSQKYGIIEPYAGASLAFNRATEQTDKVDLEAVHQLQPKLLIGARLNWRAFVAAVEYDISALNTLSYELGVKF